MPRQPKWVAAGIYQPTHQPRHAYGRRGHYTRELVEDYNKQCGVIQASEIGRYGPALLSGGLTGLQLVSVPMPRGGVRWLLTCPRCQGTYTRLYERWHQGFRTYVAACRQCWGLRYQSQYQGRRMEAHPDYLQRVTRRQIERTPHEPRGYFPVPARRQIALYTHTRRMRKYAKAENVLNHHRYRWRERKELAQDIALIILLARSIARQHRRWRKILNQILWRGHTPHIPTLRFLIAHKDTPEWARTLLKQHLERAEKGLKTPKDVQKVVKMALDNDTLAQSSTHVDVTVLDEMQARYAALGQGRRNKRAA